MSNPWGRFLGAYLEGRLDRVNYGILITSGSNELKKTWNIRLNLLRLIR